MQDWQAPTLIKNNMRYIQKHRRIPSGVGEGDKE